MMLFTQCLVPEKRLANYIQDAIDSEENTIEEWSFLPAMKELMK